MGWDDSDWKTVSYKTTKRDRFILSRLAEEEFFDSFSEAVRTAMKEMVSGSAQDAQRTSRIQELKQIYGSTSNPRMTEFFADTTHLMHRFGEFAEEHDEGWWEEEVEDYLHHYFDQEEILDYREKPEEFSREFLDTTIDMMSEFGDMSEFYRDQETFEDLDAYFAEYFAESRAEDKPYLKFKL